MKSLYKNLRCGLYHVGFPKENIILHHSLPAPIAYKAEQDLIAIDPPLWLDQIQSHFDQYITYLKDNENDVLRANFETKFR